SLCQDRSLPEDIDQYESALATSPNLYSRCVYYSRIGSYGLMEENEEAGMQLVGGLNPGNKEVVHDVQSCQIFTRVNWRHGNLLGRHGKVSFRDSHNMPYSPDFLRSSSFELVTRQPERPPDLEQVYCILQVAYSSIDELGIFGCPCVVEGTHGRLPKLKDFALYLDCSDHSHGQLGYHSVPEGDSNRVRGMLINGAIDSSLARTIFQTVNQGRKDKNCLAKPYAGF
ncbi:hypothetical protein FQN49_004633, partial [Arthroderma sp. PD_2]